MGGNLTVSSISLDASLANLSLSTDNRLQESSMEYKCPPKPFIFTGAGGSVVAAGKSGLVKNSVASTISNVSNSASTNPFLLNMVKNPEPRTTENTGVERNSAVVFTSLSDDIDNSNMWSRVVVDNSSYSASSYPSTPPKTTPSCGTPTSSTSISQNSEGSERIQGSGVVSLASDGSRSCVSTIDLKECLTFAQLKSDRGSGAVAVFVPWALSPHQFVVSGYCCCCCCND